MKHRAAAALLAIAALLAVAANGEGASAPDERPPLGITFIPAGSPAGELFRAGCFRPIGGSHNPLVLVLSTSGSCEGMRDIPLFPVP